MAAGALLARGADVDQNNSTSEVEPAEWNHINDSSCGWTSLMAASRWSRVEVARLLVEAGAEVSMKNCDGDLAVHLAAEGEEPAVLECLLEATNDSIVDAVGADGYTPLHYAAESGCENAVEVSTKILIE